MPFAVRSLENLSPGTRPGRHMLALATTLGHAELMSTHWYLEATPILLRGGGGGASPRPPNWLTGMEDPMTNLAPHLSAFLQVHLPSERRFSPHTLLSYTECFRLLVVFMSERLGIRPCNLTIEHFTVTLLTAFLEHLETDRKNGVGTRNVRLAAIKSFYRYLECRVPGCLDLALQVRAIPAKTADRPLVDWLGQTEIQAILDAPDPSTRPGLRDRAMLHLCYAAGLRVSELTTLTLDSLSGPGLETVRIMGKGRRERELPLWKETRTVLDHWLAVRPAVRSRHLFLNARGGAMSTDGFSYILKRHVATAARKRSFDSEQAGDPAWPATFRGNGDPACHWGHP